MLIVDNPEKLLTILHVLYAKLRFQVDDCRQVEKVKLHRVGWQFESDFRVYAPIGCLHIELFVGIFLKEVLFAIKQYEFNMFQPLICFNVCFGRWQFYRLP